MTRVTRVTKDAAVPLREPVWVQQCRQCQHLRQHWGGRVWKCEALRLAVGYLGYCADARAPGAVCGPEGKAFREAA